MECAITCSEVVKHFGRTEALKGVTLTVPKGSVFGFLGPNGAGKSTLLKIMVGLVRPNAGRVSVMEANPGRLRCRRQWVTWLSSSGSRLG